MIGVASIIFLIPVTMGVLYLYLLLFGALSAQILRRKQKANKPPKTRFAIAIAAHDEENVIGATVNQLKKMNYPEKMYRIHIVADYCTDRTAEIARQCGAEVTERNSGPKTGKGAALSYLFSQLLKDDTLDAIVVFDADTKVDGQYLLQTDLAIQEGNQVVQGQHIISNSKDGWFAALTSAAFLIDNKFQNLGRTQLGLSARNMGDCICISKKVLKQMGWGEGLTEDYDLRQKLLLNGHKIHYAEGAKGLGEAPRTWKQARVQRERWIKGTEQVKNRFGRKLFSEALKKKSFVLLDGVLENYLPSFSTLAVVSLGFSALCLIPPIVPPVLFLWATNLVLLLAFPCVGLLLSRAPLRAYIALASGPYFAVWRTWTVLRLKITKAEVAWVRTPHGEMSG